MKRIESTQNALVKHWKKLVTQRKEREKSAGTGAGVSAAGPPA